MRIVLFILISCVSCLGQFNPGQVALLNNSVVAAGGGSIYSDAIFYLDLDETTGTRADSTSNGYDFTDNGSPAYESGVLNNAIYFQRANNNYLNLADNADVSLGGDVDCTIHGWIYITNNTTQFQGILTKRTTSSSSTAEYGLYYGNTVGDINFYCWDGSAFDLVTTNISGFTANTWYFVAAGRDAVTDTVWISYNAGDRVTVASNTTVDGGADVNVGRLWNNDAANDFDGRIDELSFWKSAKSEADIDTAYGSGTPPGYSP